MCMYVIYSFNDMYQIPVFNGFDSFSKECLYLFQSLSMTKPVHIGQLVTSHLKIMWASSANYYLDSFSPSLSLPLFPSSLSLSLSLSLSPPLSLPLSLSLCSHLSGRVWCLGQGPEICHSHEQLQLTHANTQVSQPANITMSSYLTIRARYIIYSHQKRYT